MIEILGNGRTVFAPPFDPETYADNQPHITRVEDAVTSMTVEVQKITTEL